MAHAPVYLDYNATTPVDGRVLDAMLPFLKESFGNASSKHYFGHAPREALARARSQVAELLHTVPETSRTEAEEAAMSEGTKRLEDLFHNVVFTSGGTEANNHALISTALLLQRSGLYSGAANHIVTTNVEHWAVHEALSFLEREHGFRITKIPVDENCLVNVEAVAAAVEDETVIVTVMHANNEIGSIQPIAEIAKLISGRVPKPALHTDAAQSIGKVVVDVHDLGVDLLTVAGHKLYAPKGVGALYINSRFPAFAAAVPGPFIHGASQELGLRGGTENVAGNVALGAAAEIARTDFHTNVKHMVDTRAMLVDGLERLCHQRGQRMVRNGRVDRTLPNTLSVSFPGINAYDLIDKVKELVCFSAGAACHSGGPVASATLRAMGIPNDVALGTVRLSTGKLLQAADVEFALQQIGAAMDGLLAAKATQ
mmetsp:Transcript_198/g.668  ORF Transcript_198/g.668 Transcript_198/m.668 type:complete len:428 (+) Transcript_198:55-1338(+)